MADVDLRKLRYFVAVAEQLHFGRAAEALHIAQPVLSRQIRALEDELKAQLFVRDKRATELTPAGRQLLADAGPLLASADALRRRVVRAARGPGSFTIGFMPGLIVTEAVRALAGRYPQLTVNVMRTNWDDQTDVLHDGRADVSYIRHPAQPAHPGLRRHRRGPPARRQPGSGQSPVTATPAFSIISTCVGASATGRCSIPRGTENAIPGVSSTGSRSSSSMRRRPSMT
jgi:DNA-binding transcriptional LysR family regulator